MAVEQTGTRRWFRGLGGRPAADTRLFCLHYAGGGASLYRSWSDAFPSSTEVVAVQLPGRENRLAEAAYDSMGPLAEELAARLVPHLDRPYAFFGYSMGARLGWVLSQLLRDRAVRQPGLLFAAASPGPCLRTPVSGWNEPDEGLVAYLRELGGTAPEVLDQPDLLSLLLPTLRADLTAVATWPYPEHAPLEVPIHALAGEDDPYASPERMRAWERETAAGFRLNVLPGGHFFVKSAVRRTLDLVVRDMGLLTATAADGAVETG
ncbi:thioesterase domain-containing protein [Nocardiopsis sp. ARC36]